MCVYLCGQFAAECDATGVRNSTYKSEAVVLSRKRVDCSLQVGRTGLKFPSEGLQVLRVLIHVRVRIER